MYLLYFFRRIHVFDELSEEEMIESQGSGDTQEETTPVCLVIATVASAGVISTIINK